MREATNLTIGGVYRQGNIFLNVRMLDSPGLTKLVAHELGHYVLGHDSIIPQAVSQAEWERAQQQRELDANAKAVEILVRAQGLSENAALQTVVALSGRRGVTPLEPVGASEATCWVSEDLCRSGTS